MFNLWKLDGQCFFAVPCEATGYGNNSIARNVFCFELTGAGDELSSLVKYECYDNDNTFPAVDTQTSNTNDIFVNGASSYSMICLVDTSNVAPSSNWKPSAPSAGEANPNRMKGQTNYVEQDGSILAQATNPRATFNMVIEIPSSAQTSYTMGFDLLVRYTYTQASAPTVAFKINEGTEGTPTWTALTVGTHGIKHCRSGSSSSDCFANIPETGNEDTADGWALTA
jgi:hypothetical protein